MIKEITSTNTSNVPGWSHRSDHLAHTTLSDGVVVVGVVLLRVRVTNEHHHAGGKVVVHVAVQRLCARFGVRGGGLRV